MPAGCGPGRTDPKEGGAAGQSHPRHSSARGTKRLDLHPDPGLFNHGVVPPQTLGPDLACNCCAKTSLRTGLYRVLPALAPCGFVSVWPLARVLDRNQRISRRPFSWAASDIV